MSLATLVRRARRMPPDALFSGRTAAWLHGIDVPPCEPIEVTLPQRSRTSHMSAMRVIRSDYGPSEACDVQGVRVTSAIRTVADLCRHEALMDGVPILDMALRQRITELDELREWIDLHPRHRGLSRLSRAIKLADPSAESPMESRLRVLLMTNGLPRPEVQTVLYDPDGVFIARPDLLFPESRLVLEYDGAIHRERLGPDNRRQNRLIEAGYRVLRFTAGDILNRPAAVVGQVRRALAYSSSGSPN